MKLHKILFLYSELMPYSIASLNRLFESSEFDICVIHWSKKLKTPYKASSSKIRLIDKQDIKNLNDFCLNFNPDLMFISGRMDNDYLKIARLFKLRGVYVISGFDTQYKPSLKTLIKIIFGKFLYKKYFNSLWVCGARQKIMAKKIGYKDEEILKNLYSCDSDLFSNVKPNYKAKSLIFIGRLDKVKNIESLCSIFKDVNESINDTWTLNVIGDGPLLSKLRNQYKKYNCINILGFKTQDEIINIIKKSTVFVLPSNWEPFGVVVHECAYSGLPILCSKYVGSSDYFLRDGQNGFIFSNNKELKIKLKKLFSLGPTDFHKMGRISISLANRIDSKNWLRELKHVVNNKRI